jgi:hypothetical protein
MRRRLGIILATVSISALIAGCSAVTPMNGGLYTNLKGPVAVGPASGSSKVGRAQSTAIIGIATGDSSISAAMANGKITKVHHVDSEVSNLLGIYATYTTVVYGE